MKLEKHIEKLIAFHSPDLVATNVIRAVSCPKVLLQISNYCMLKSNEGRTLGDKDQEKIWRKRAKIIHDVMEEIENETKNSNSVNI